MEVLWGVIAMAACAGLGAATERIPLFRPASPGAPPLAGPDGRLGRAPGAAAAGLVGAGAVGMAAFSSRFSLPAAAILGFVLVVVSDDLTAGLAVRLDRLGAAALVAGSALLPFLRYGAVSFAELRGASFVLGAPLVAGPANRRAECIVGFAVGVVALAWLAGGPDIRVPLLATPTRPRLLVAGAGGLLLTAAYAGSAVPQALSAAGRLGRLGPEAVMVVGVAVVAAVGGRLLRRVPGLGLAALVGAVLLAGAGAGLAT